MNKLFEKVFREAAWDANSKAEFLIRKLRDELETSPHPTQLLDAFKQLLADEDFDTTSLDAAADERRAKSKENSRYKRSPEYAKEQEELQAHFASERAQAEKNHAAWERRNWKKELAEFEKTGIKKRKPVYGPGNGWTDDVVGYTTEYSIDTFEDWKNSENLRGTNIPKNKRFKYPDLDSNTKY